jgi:hypothetical protein
VVRFRGWWVLVSVVVEFRWGWFGVAMVGLSAIQVQLVLAVLVTMVTIVGVLHVLVVIGHVGQVDWVMRWEILVVVV